MEQQISEETGPELRQQMVPLLSPFSRNYGAPERDPVYGRRCLYNLGIRKTEE